MEGAVVSGSRSRRVMWEQSTQVPDPRLVFNGVEDLVVRYLEWNEVGLYCTSLARFKNTPECFIDSDGVVA